MRLFNTLTRAEEEFVPGRRTTVRIYTCGLTVYARGHIGNFRTFVSLDVLRRALRHLEGYEVRQVRNFTDVDDRTIAASEKAGVRAARVHAAMDRHVRRGRRRASRSRAGRRESACDRPREPRTRWPTWSTRSAIAATRISRTDRRTSALPTFPGLREARAARSRRHAGRRARGRRQLHEAGRPRLRALEGVETGRADLGRRLRARPAGLAHRVLGHGRAPAGARRRSTSMAAAST